MHINDLLKTATDRGASDLHLKVGSHPVIRVDGRLMPLKKGFAHMALATRLPIVPVVVIAGADCPPLPRVARRTGRGSASRCRRDRRNGGNRLYWRD